MAQLPAMSKEQEGVFQRAEEEVVERAVQEATEAEGRLSGKREVEIIEQALHELAREVMEIDASNTRARREEGAIHSDAKVKRWRRVLAWASGLSADAKELQPGYSEVPRILGGGKGGEGDEPRRAEGEMADQELLTALRTDAAGRRAALMDLAMLRATKQERKREEAAKELGGGNDRVAERLLAKLEECAKSGAPQVWEIFRAVGEARAELVGVKTRPTRGRATISSVTACLEEAQSGPENRPLTGARAVAAELAKQAAAMHQEKGGSVEAMVALFELLDGVGSPMASVGAEVVETPVGKKERLKAEQTRAERMAGTEWPTVILSDAALDAGRQKFRPVQGVGKDGNSGYHLRMAGAATWQRYKRAMREMAGELHTASEGLRAAETEGAHRDGLEAVRRSVPEAWTTWLVILLAKPGKAPDRFSNMRDIYLQPHGLKLFMNGLKPMYDMCAEGVVPLANAGFREDREAPEQTLTMAILQEQAEDEGKPWYRGFIDFAGFFQSVVRRVQEMVEMRAGVAPQVVEVVIALHDSLQVAVDTGERISPAVPSLTGNGQGDTDGPVRSMLMLAAMMEAVERLCVGAELRMPAGAGRRRVVQVFFADDGAFGTSDFEALQVVFYVASTVARAEGLVIGIVKGGKKTAWHGAEPDGRGNMKECGDERRIELIDGRTVPRAVGRYKHLGGELEVGGGYAVTRRKVVNRCKAIAGMVARLGCLTAAQYVQTVDVATRSIIMYYGAAAPLGREACEEIDRAKRTGLAALGHRARRSARWLVHTPHKAGGMGMGLAYAHAGAALVAEIERVLSRPGTPAYLAVTSQIAVTYWRLGWRPTGRAPRPLDWWPQHLRGNRALREDRVIEQFLATCLEAGMRTEARGGRQGGDALAEGWWGEASEDPADASVWEAEGRTYSWRLAQLGIVTRRDLYGGVAADGAGRWRRPKEIEAVYGKRHREMGRMVARLSGTEQAELRCLMDELTPEEHGWARNAVAVRMTVRPMEPMADSVLRKRVGRNGRLEYLVQRRGRSAGWEPRPGRLSATAKAQRVHMDAQQAETGEALRGELAREYGEAWLWLAAEAPMAVGMMDRAGLVAAAEGRGVMLTQMHGAEQRPYPGAARERGLEEGMETEAGEGEEGEGEVEVEGDVEEEEEAEAEEEGEVEEEGEALELRRQVRAIIEGADLSVLTSRMVRQQLVAKGIDASDKRAVKGHISACVEELHSKREAGGAQREAATPSSRKEAVEGGGGGATQEEAAEAMEVGEEEEAVAAAEAVDAGGGGEGGTAERGQAAQGRAVASGAEDGGKAARRAVEAAGRGVEAKAAEETAERDAADAADDLGLWESDEELCEGREQAYTRVASTAKRGLEAAAATALAHAEEQLARARTERCSARAGGAAGETAAAEGRAVWWAAEVVVMRAQRGAAELVGAVGEWATRREGAERAGENNGAARTGEARELRRFVAGRGRESYGGVKGREWERWQMGVGVSGRREQEWVDTLAEGMRGAERPAEAEDDSCMAAEGEGRIWRVGNVAAGPTARGAGGLTPEQRHRMAEGLATARRRVAEGASRVEERERGRREAVAVCVEARMEVATAGGGTGETEGGEQEGEWGEEAEAAWAAEMEAQLGQTEAQLEEAEMAEERDEHEHGTEEEPEDEGARGKGTSDDKREAQRQRARSSEAEAKARRELKRVEREEARERAEAEEDTREEAHTARANGEEMEGKDRAEEEEEGAGAGGGGRVEEAEYFEDMIPEMQREIAV